MDQVVIKMNIVTGYINVFLFWCLSIHFYNLNVCNIVELLMCTSSQRVLLWNNLSQTQNFNKCSSCCSRELKVTEISMLFIYQNSLWGSDVLLVYRSFSSVQIVPCDQYQIYEFDVIIMCLHAMSGQIILSTLSIIVKGARMSK